MIENSVHIRYKDKPVLLDRALQDIQGGLLSRLKWLNYAFGRVYKLVEYKPEGFKFTYPAVYNGQGEYLSMVPNDNLGNFSWFEIYDPQKVIQVAPGSSRYSFNGAIVFWYNLSSIYTDEDVLHTEEIKSEIIKALTSPGLTTSGSRVTVTEIYEQFENIYKGYVISGDRLADGDRQFLMYPYAGIRVEFNLLTKELCV